jgi:hypothetical protein
VTPALIFFVKGFPMRPQQSPACGLVSVAPAAHRDGGQYLAGGLPQPSRQAAPALDERVLRNLAFSEPVGGPLAEVSLHRSDPGWNVLSVLAPVIGFLGALLVAMNWHGHPMGMILPCLGVFAGSLGLGLFSALVAFFRSERCWGLTALGLILNGVPFTLAAGLWLAP